MNRVVTAARAIDTISSPSHAAGLVRCRYEGPQAAAPETSFRDDVLAGLGATAKSLPCKYFYDEQGSALFEQICELPEYYPTRTELAIMRSEARRMAEEIGPDALVVEFGSGSSTKTRLLLDQLQRPAGYVPVDISGAHLEASAAALRAEYPRLEVVPIAGDFTRTFELPDSLCAVAKRIVVYFPGSTIGNFTTIQAEQLLGSIAALVGPGGGLLIGADLVKATDVLERAYDDAQGVTAAFNLNLLARINRELGADFQTEHFRHVARYDEARARIEILIESLREQQVRIDGHSIRFEAGEHILTEYSHKYTLNGFAALARVAGFEVARAWSDPESRFSVQYLTLPAAR
jgi:dimethylhistidine N-methyltransferase